MLVHYGPERSASLQLCRDKGQRDRLVLAHGNQAASAEGKRNTGHFSRSDSSRMMAAALESSEGTVLPDGSNRVYARYGR